MNEGPFSNRTSPPYSWRFVAKSRRDARQGRGARLERCATSGKGGTGETDDGSRSEVWGSGTANPESGFSCQSRPSR